jgi:hypothetical protein
MIQKDGMQTALPYIFMKMKIAIDSANPDPKQRKRLARKTMEQFPKLRPMIKKWAKSMNELVGE